MHSDPSTTHFFLAVSIGHLSVGEKGSLIQRMPASKSAASVAFKEGIDLFPDYCVLAHYYALVLAFDTNECWSWRLGPVPEKIKILFDCLGVGALRGTAAELCLIV